MSNGELLRDHLVITGNLLYDSGPNGVVENGKLSADTLPHYAYAVWIEPVAAGRMNHLHFSDNLFPPGEHRVSNVDVNRRL